MKQLLTEEAREKFHYEPTIEQLTLLARNELSSRYPYQVTPNNEILFLQDEDMELSVFNCTLVELCYIANRDVLRKSFVNNTKLCTYDGELVDRSKLGFYNDYLLYNLVESCVDRNTTDAELNRSSSLKEEYVKVVKIANRVFVMEDGRYARVLQVYAEYSLVAVGSADVDLPLTSKDIVLRDMLNDYILKCEVYENENE